MEQTRTLSSSELKRQSLVNADGFSSRVSGLLGESSREPSRVPLGSHHLYSPDGQGCQHIAIERHSALEEQSSAQRDPLSYGLSLDMCEMPDSILQFDSLQSCSFWYEISLKAVISYPHTHRITAIKRQSTLGGQYSVQKDPLTYRLSLDMCEMSDSTLQFHGSCNGSCWYEILLRVVFPYAHTHRGIAIEMHDAFPAWGVARETSRFTGSLWTCVRFSSVLCILMALRFPRVGKRCSTLVAFSGYIRNQEFFLHFHGLLQASHDRGRVDAGMN